MNWMQATKGVSAVALLAFGLYGAFLAGRAQAPGVCRDALDTPRAAMFRKATRNRSIDGRFGTICNLCQVSMFRLIASPERYDQKEVMTYGFLQGTSGADLRLFPTLESKQRTDGAYEAITISGTLSDAMWAKVEAGIWVQISGHFDADGGYNIGGIYDAHIEDHFRSDPPRVPTPSLKDIKPRPAVPPQFEILPETTSR